jgi:hypothetical protein
MNPMLPECYQTQLVHINPINSGFESKFVSMGNTGTIAIIILVLVILILFIIIRNRKDKKEFEEQLNQDYRKPKSGEVDSEGTDSV